MSLEINSSSSSNSTEGVHWTPPAHVGQFGNFGLICLEYLIYVGMNSCDDQMQNNIDYDNAMQPGQGDMIDWFAYLNRIETEAGKDGLSPQELAKMVKEFIAKFKQFFGNSVLPKGDQGWSLSAKPGQPGYIDPNSDFGKWMKALYKANTDGNGNPINGWPGFKGDQSVATVTDQIKELNRVIPNSSNNMTFLEALQAGNTDILGRDINALAKNYYEDKQPNQSGKDQPSDYLSDFVVFTKSTNGVFQGIGTQQTTLLQQLSSTLNGETNNGDSIVKAVGGLLGFINSHTNAQG